MWLLKATGSIPGNVLADHRQRRPAAKLPPTPPGPRPSTGRTERRLSDTVISIHSGDSASEPDSEEELPARKKQRNTRAPPRNGILASYSDIIQNCLDGAEVQFRLTLWGLDTMLASLECYDRVRDAIRAEATRLNIDGTS